MTSLRIWQYIKQNSLFVKLSGVDSNDVNLGKNHDVYFIEGWIIKKKVKKQNKKNLTKAP